MNKYDGLRRLEIAPNPTSPPPTPHAKKRSWLSPAIRLAVSLLIVAASIIGRYLPSLAPVSEAVRRAVNYDIIADFSTQNPDSDETNPPDSENSTTSTNSHETAAHFLAHHLVTKSHYLVISHETTPILPSGKTP